jgi:hypothetical protein
VRGIAGWHGPICSQQHPYSAIKTVHLLIVDKSTRGVTPSNAKKDSPLPYALFNTVPPFLYSVLSALTRDSSLGADERRFLQGLESRARMQGYVLTIFVYGEGGIDESRVVHGFSPTSVELMIRFQPGIGRALMIKAATGH